MNYKFALRNWIQTQAECTILCLEMCFGPFQILSRFMSYACSIVGPQNCNLSRSNLQECPQKLCLMDAVFVYLATGEIFNLPFFISRLQVKECHKKVHFYTLQKVNLFKAKSIKRGAPQNRKMQIICCEIETFHTKSILKDVVDFL